MITPKLQLFRIENAEEVRPAVSWDKPAASVHPTPSAAIEEAAPSVVMNQEMTSKDVGDVTHKAEAASEADDGPVSDADDEAGVETAEEIDNTPDEGGETVPEDAGDATHGEEAAPSVVMDPETAPIESPQSPEDSPARDANTTEAAPDGGSGVGLGLNKKGVTPEAEQRGSMNASQAMRHAEGQGAPMGIPSFGFAQLLANGLLMPFHAIQGLLRPLTQRGPSWTPKTFSLDQASVDGFRNRRADEAMKTYQASGKHLDKVMESLVDTRKNEDIAQLIGKLRAAPSEEARQALIGQALKSGRITNRKVADMWENIFTAMETHREKAHDAMAAAANAGRKDGVEQIHAQWASKVEGIQKNNAWMDTMTNGEFSKRMREDAQKMAEKVRELVESIVRRLRAMFGHGDEGGPAPTA